LPAICLLDFLPHRLEFVIALQGIASLMLPSAMLMVADGRK